MAAATALETQTLPQTSSSSWVEQLSTLASVPNEDLLGHLENALQLAKKDQQWSSSGVPELLMRATEMAGRGAFVSARSSALNLLGFHTAALKYKAVTARARSGSSGSETQGPAADGASSSSSTSSDSTSTDVAGAQPVVLQLNTAGSSSLLLPGVESFGSDSDPNTPSSGSDPSAATTDPTGLVRRAEFLAPEPKRRRIVPTDNAAAAAARGHEGRLIMNAAQTSESSEVLTGDFDDWTGVLSLASEDGGRASDLCHATIQLPQQIAQSVPRTLHFTHLVQRRGVMLGKYQVCRTSIKKTNMRQMSRLRSMAQHELVAVAALPCAHVIIVPYMGGPNNAEVRLVSFALSA